MSITVWCLTGGRVCTAVCDTDTDTYEIRLGGALFGDPSAWLGSLVPPVTKSWKVRLAVGVNV